MAWESAGRPTRVVRLLTNVQRKVEYSCGHVFRGRAEHKRVYGVDSEACDLLRAIECYSKEDKMKGRNDKNLRRRGHECNPSSFFP